MCRKSHVNLLMRDLVQILLKHWNIRENMLDLGSKSSLSDVSTTASKKTVELKKLSEVMTGDGEPGSDNSCGEELAVNAVIICRMAAGALKGFVIRTADLHFQRLHFFLYNRGISCLVIRLLLKFVLGV